MVVDMDIKISVEAKPASFKVCFQQSHINVIEKFLLSFRKKLFNNEELFLFFILVDFSF